jgi:hypothetical protein
MPTRSRGSFMLTLFGMTVRSIQCRVPAGGQGSAALAREAREKPQATQRDAARL